MPKEKKEQTFDPSKQCFFCQKEITKCHCDQGKKHRQMFSMIGISFPGEKKDKKKDKKKKKKTSKRKKDKTPRSKSEKPKKTTKKPKTRYVQNGMIIDH